MKKSSKVKSVTIGDSYESNGTTYYNHNYVMEDGQKIQASHKEQNKFSVGDEVEYEVKRTHPTYGDSGSVSKPQNNNFRGGGGYKPDTVGITVGACLNLAVSMYNAGKFDDIKKVESTADWLVEMSFRLKAKHADKA